MRIVGYILVLMLSATYLVSCNGNKSSAFGNDQDPVLATVIEDELRMSAIAPLIPPNISPKDSLQIIRTFTETWVRDRLIQNEAEKNIRDLSQIDKLVNDYKSSLIMFEYEHLLVENLLDSTITAEDLESQYHKEKKQFTLENSIYQFHLLSIDSDHEGYFEIRKF